MVIRRSFFYRSVRNSRLVYLIKLKLRNRRSLTVNRFPINDPNSPMLVFQESLGFWTLRFGFRITILSGIPDSDSLRWIKDSKVQDSRFHKQKSTGIVSTVHSCVHGAIQVRDFCTLSQTKNPFTSTGRGTIIIRVTLTRRYRSASGES